MTETYALSPQTLYGGGPGPVDDPVYGGCRRRPALRGIEQIRNFFAPGLGKSRVTFEIDIEEIQVHGDTAHLLSKYYLTSEPEPGGETYRDAGRSLLIYKRNADNEWKLYLDIDQATPDARF